jgi:hypothetical protein
LVESEGENVAVMTEVPTPVIVKVDPETLMTDDVADE